MDVSTTMTTATNTVITVPGRRKAGWIIIRRRTDMHTTKDSFRINRLVNMDCMDALSRYPDDFFQLAIIDPHYCQLAQERLDATMAQVRMEV